MTTKVYCYSLTGKTEAALELVKRTEIMSLNKCNPTEFRFGDEKTVVIGTPTYGRGVPPKYFKDILPQLRRLEGREIGLFGSGNTIYGDDYCGALDVLEELLARHNVIVFKYKFEGYPRDTDKLKIKEFIEHNERRI